MSEINSIISKTVVLISEIRSSYKKNSDATTKLSAIFTKFNNRFRKLVAWKQIDAVGEGLLPISNKIIKIFNI